VVTSFHVQEPATRKERRPNSIDSLTAGRSRSSDEEDRSICRDGGVSDRYESELP